MARRKFTRDEQRERLKILLDKAKESLAAYESRLRELDKEREKLAVKIKSKKTQVEKYQALTKESQFNVLDEMLRLKGINIEDVTRAIANGNTEYLLELTELKNAEEEAGSEPLTGLGAESERETKPIITHVPEAKTVPGVDPVNINMQSGGSLETNRPVRQERPAITPEPPYRTDMSAIQSGQAITDLDRTVKQRPFVQNNNLT